MNPGGTGRVRSACFSLHASQTRGRPQCGWESAVDEGAQAEACATLTAPHRARWVPNRHVHAPHKLWGMHSSKQSGAGGKSGWQAEACATNNGSGPHSPLPFFLSFFVFLCGSAPLRRCCVAVALLPRSCAVPQLRGDRLACRERLAVAVAVQPLALVPGHEQRRGVED